LNFPPPAFSPSVFLFLLLVLAACDPRVERPIVPHASAPERRASDHRPDPCRAREPELVATLPVATVLDDLEVARTHEVWPAMIDEARHSIELEHFYVASRPGSRLEPVIAALERAHQRGVKVRLVVDAGFARLYPDDLARLEPFMEVRRFDARATLGGVQHAKAMRVDGCALFIGSANFDWRSLEHIREVGVRLQSRELASLVGDVFELDWKLAGGDTTPPTGTSASSPPSRTLGDADVTPAFSPLGWLPEIATFDLLQIRAAIASAKRELVLELLTFESTWRSGDAYLDLENDLASAARRGVKVRILVSHWNTAGDRLEGLRRLAKVAGIAVRIATIPEHPDGFIPFARVVHAKYMVIDDDVAWIGSSNWSGDYFFKSRNLGLFVRSGALPGGLEAFFEALWSSPLAADLDPTRVYPPPRVER
jgi:phosphatidylserine/phosphatidylglycerophosphate/cardiolipin synthase-like enzyme